MRSAVTATGLSSRERASRVIVTTVLAVEVALALYVLATQLPVLWADRWVQDDAYVSFRYAHNLVRGDGLVYNPGDRVEGYSNFLWTMLSAIPLAAGAQDPLPFMHAVSAVLWAGSYAALLLLGVRLGWRGIWAAPLGVVPLAHHWSFNMWFFSGMETPLVSFLTILTVLFFSRDPERHPSTLGLSSLCGVLLSMTRPDGVVVLAALAVTGLVLYGHRLRRRECRWVYVVLPALPVVLIWLPYNAWRVAYYGSFLPNTYYTKVAYLTFYARGWDYLTKYLSTYGLTPYLPFIVVGALVAPGRPGARYLLSSFIVAASVAFYLVRLGGDFMEWRFLTPVTGILYPAAVVGASLNLQELALWPTRLRRRGGRRFTVSAGGVVPDWARAFGWLGGAVIALSLTHTTSRAQPDHGDSIMGGQETIGLLRRYGDEGRFDWRLVGKTFDEVLPPDVRIATTSAGIIPFFCDRPCLDLHGLTDREIAHMPVDPKNRGRMGHEHWLEDLDRIRERGVDVLLHWAEPRNYPRALVTPPDKGRETVSVKLPDGRYVEFLILNPDAFDREKLKNDPRLVLFGSSEVWPKDKFRALLDRFGDWVTVDEIDLENGTSQEKHSYDEFYPPELPGHHVYHTKWLNYRSPFEEAVLEDDGRRIYLGATWKVHDVLPGRELVMIGRFDRTGGAEYALEVNGVRVPGQLDARGAAPEAWDEAWISIPPDRLVEGTNELRMTRVSSGTSDVEWYYFWFVQPADAAVQQSDAAEVGD